MVSSQLHRILTVRCGVRPAAVSRFAHGIMVSSQLHRILTVRCGVRPAAVSRFAHGISS
jgi:DNA-binding MurR/RpiR family transcriptional regulator